MPLTCCLSPILSTFAFKTIEVKHLLSNMDPYGGADPFDMFPLFLKRNAADLAPHLSVVLRRLDRLGSFPACSRQTNVTPIPKGLQSSSVAN